jgi:site-specific DNA-methyltransferase (adenine-specific)
VDLNISRVLQVFSSQKAGLSIADNITYLIKNRLINIDIDLLSNMKMDHNAVITKLLDIWKGDPIVGFKSLLKKLDEDYVLFDNPTQKLLNKTFNRVIPGDRITLLLKDDGDEGQDLPSGREKIKISGDEGVSLPIVDDIADEAIEKMQVSFTKDVLPYVIPLVCILTLPTESLHLLTMFAEIKANPDLLDTFDDQCIIWWNKKELIDVIKDIIVKFINGNNNSCSYNITSQFKLSMKSLIDSPKELLELIHECLRPKEIEKKEFGEVFTPMPFISEMLSSIEEHYTSIYSESIWSNPMLTWYDPAAGMGNFPIAIYYKLMEGLSGIITDICERKKHIIEKQLYLGELNKKNCFILKQIFNITDEYTMNLYCGDTLTINLTTVFNKKSFDVIIGNPPYNEELTRVGAKPLYHKFIEYYLNKCSLLSFVVPSRWFSGGKGLDKFRTMMINRTDILFIKHFPDAKKIFGNSVDIKGGVNYFLIDKDYSGLCEYNGTKVKFNTYDVIIDSKYYGIVDKFITVPKITDIYISQDYYKIQTNDVRLESVIKEGYIKCYVSQQKGFIKYIDKIEIIKNSNNYKVITARAAFGANSGFGNTFIGFPDEVHTKSYISFNTETEDEAKALLSYLKCKLPNFLLSLRKSSQDISAATCAWIPLPPLDREWTDDDVYSYYSLSPDEIMLIQHTKINGYSDNSVPEIIIDGQQKLYLIGNKLYLIKKDKTPGDYVRDYLDNVVNASVNLGVIPATSGMSIISPQIQTVISKDSDNKITPKIKLSSKLINTKQIQPYEIIKDGRKKLYLIKDKLYKVRRDGSVGVYVCNYNPK